MNQPEDSNAEDRPPVPGRRSFLRGESAVRWWRDWNREALPRPSIAPLSPLALSDQARAVVSPEGTLRPGFLYHLSKSAMACQWDVYLNHGQYINAAECALTALEWLEPIEAELSIFRPHSEITRLNATAFEQAVNVSESLFQILQMSQHLHELTEGAFDITSSRLSECWGFLKREGRLPSDQEIAVSLEAVGMNKLVLNPDDRSVRFLHPQLAINLGGIGKGWALDEVSAGLLTQGVNDFAFHGGQSSVVARGRQLQGDDPQASTGGKHRPQSLPAAGQPAIPQASGNGADGVGASAIEDKGWPIGLTHPLLPDTRLGRIDLRNRALGTSGSGRQFIHYRGRRLSHILDPRTGRPAEGVWSATVVAPTAAQADALGTACFVLGVAGCERLVQRCEGLAVILVVPQGSRCQVITLGQTDDSPVTLF